MIDIERVHGRSSINMDVQAFDIERFDSVSFIGGMHADGHFKCWSSYITTLKHARQ